MNPKEKNEGDVVSWTHRDSLILVQRLLALGMTDDTGFDWKQLEDDTWGRLFSTHIMQVRWRRLKKKYSKAVEDATLPGASSVPSIGGNGAIRLISRSDRIAREDHRPARAEV